MKWFSFRNFFLEKAKDKNIDSTKQDNLLRISEYTFIPYEDLWCSAIRCKMLYIYNNRIKNLWSFVNRIEDTIEVIDLTNMDEAYIRELRNISEPVYLDTMNFKKSKKYNTSAALWYRDDIIYITFHVNEYIEKKLLKKQKKQIRIFDNIYVNCFFYKELLRILPSIIKYIEELKIKHSHKQIRIVVAGYSLVGIIVHITSAVLAHIFVDQNFYIACHSFGSPKSGNKHFVKWFNTYVHENYRIVNGNDPMTLFPIDHRWCHVQNKTIQFDMDLHVNISAKKVAWYKRSWLNYFIIRNIIKNDKKDHEFDVYINRLWKYSRLTKYIKNTSMVVKL